MHSLKLVVVLALAIISLHVPASAQATAHGFAVLSDSTAGAYGEAAPHSIAVHAVPPLPAALTPEAPPGAALVRVPAENGPTPYLLGLAGGVAGLFVGKWAMTRGCQENCAQQALLGGMIGILGGAALGYVIGGGEMVRPPPR